MGGLKQYINWKKLIICAVIFWVLLCSFDSYFIDPATKYYYTKRVEDEWSAPIYDDTVVEPATLNLSEDIQVQVPEEKYGTGECLVVWNVIAFITTIIVCIGAKFASHCFKRFRNNGIRIGSIEEEMGRKSSISKIPILTTGSRSVVNIDCSKKTSQDLFFKSTTFTDLSVRSSRSEVTAHYMEKQCSKLRDDMIAMQALSLKEHTALSRKLESMSREKRDLCRQLMLAQKENRAAQQQLEELAVEKTLLLKRLDSATKEFKTNTKSKKSVLAKLEETQLTILNLRQEIETLKTERNDLLNLYRALSLENQQLKDHIILFEKRIEREIAYNTITQEQSNNLEEINQSHKDVQKVQMRLMNLEKSLDKLQLSQWRKKIEEGKPALQIDSQEEEINVKENESSSPILTRAEIPLEEQRVKSGKIKTGNLTDEQLEKILIPEESFNDEIASATKDLNDLMNEVKIGKPFREMSTSKSVSESDCELGCLDDPIYIKTRTSPDDEDDNDDNSDEWEQYRCRIVSNSTAFKNFLQKMDHIDQLHTKLSVPM